MTTSWMFLAALSGAACSLGSAAAQDVAWPTNAERWPGVAGVRERSGRLLVRPRQIDDWTQKGICDATAAARTAVARARLNALETGLIREPDIHVVTPPAGLSDAALADLLLATGDYEFAEPDWIVYPTDTTPDDAAFGQAWHLRRINAPQAWDRTTGDGSLMMAFVDTGVDTSHPDLAGVLAPGYNAVTHLWQSQGGQINDVNGHGTGVAGAAAAIGNNGVGGSGVCWNVRVMPIRASNLSSGAAYLSDVLYGAVYGAYAGARIVSVSFAGIESSAVEPTGQAIKQQYDGLLFWAAGNSNTSLNFNYPATTVVGSTDAADLKAPDSNYGPGVDLMAPGVGIVIPQPGGGYGVGNGTSYDTPVAAATLALAWSRAPWMSADRAMASLYQGCIDLGDPGRDPIFGIGRVDAARTLAFAVGPSGMEAGSNSLPPIGTEGTSRGMVVHYYAVADVSRLPEFTGHPIGSAYISTINLAQGTFPGCPRTQQLGAQFETVFDAPATAAYTFSLDSLDGSRLWVDDVLVADNDGVHLQTVRYGTVNLDRGPHRMRCCYFTVDGPPRLVVRVRGAELGEILLPTQVMSFFLATDSMYPPATSRR